MRKVRTKPGVAVAALDGLGQPQEGQQQVQREQAHGNQAELGADVEQGVVRHGQRQRSEGLAGEGVVVELEVPGPDAQQRMVGGQPGGCAPGAEPSRDVLLGDLLLEHQRLLEPLRVAVDHEQRPERGHEPGGHRHLQPAPVREHEEQEPCGEPDERTARKAEQDRRRDESDRAEQERPQQPRSPEQEEHERQRGGEDEGEVVLAACTSGSRAPPSRSGTRSAPVPRRSST